jgi:hypothetical protein
MPNSSLGVGGVVGAFNGGIPHTTVVRNSVALAKTIEMRDSASIPANRNWYIGRVHGGDIGRGVDTIATLTNNYARSDMTLRNLSWSGEIPTTSVKHGTDVSAVDTHGANSAAWWSATANFSPDFWDFAPSRLPHLKGFPGVTQNPVVRN